MPYQLAPAAPLARELRRVAREQTEAALAQLDGDAERGDASCSERQFSLATASTRNRNGTSNRACRPIGAHRAVKAHMQPIGLPPVTAPRKCSKSRRGACCLIHRCRRRALSFQDISEHDAEHGDG